MAAFSCVVGLSLVGCVDAPGTSTGPGRSRTGSGIPRSAWPVADGRGELTWLADADGTVYVQDADRGTLLVTHAIKRGQRLRVVPSDNRVKIDDDTISREDLTSDHTHKVYIERTGRDADRASSGSEDQVPKGSDLMGRGSNRELSFVAAADGRVYLFDEEAQRVIDSTAIERGQRFTFSPGRHRATIDGKTAIDDDHIDSGRTYAVYFTRD